MGGSAVGGEDKGEESLLGISTLGQPMRGEAPACCLPSTYCYASCLLFLSAICSLHTHLRTCTNYNILRAGTLNGGHCSLRA